MTIYEDTGNKLGKHDNIAQYMEENGIKLTRVKLDTGDYCMAPLAVVDTKKGLEEVYQDLVTDHDRFHREYVRALEDGIRLVFLIENIDGITCVDDVKNWINPLAARYAKGKIKVKPRSSEALMRQMQTVAERYGVRWEFCKPCDTGRRIVDILCDANGR